MARWVRLLGFAGFVMTGKDIRIFLSCFELHFYFWERNAYCWVLLAGLKSQCKAKWMQLGGVTFFAAKRVWFWWMDLLVLWCLDWYKQRCQSEIFGMSERNQCCNVWYFCIFDSQDEMPIAGSFASWVWTGKIKMQVARCDFLGCELNEFPYANLFFDGCPLEWMQAPFCWFLTVWFSVGSCCKAGWIWKFGQILCHVSKARQGWFYDRKIVMQHLTKAASLGIWTEESKMQVIKGFGWSATGFSWQGYKAWFLFFCYDSQWKKCPASKDEVGKWVKVIVVAISVWFCVFCLFFLTVLDRKSWMPKQPSQFFFERVYWFFDCSLWQYQVCSSCVAIWQKNGEKFCCESTRQGVEAWVDGCKVLIFQILSKWGMALCFAVG